MSDSAATAKDARAVVKVRPETTLDILTNQGRALTELTARFPKDLQEPMAAKQFLAVCLGYDLDPFSGEIVPFQGRPYVAEQGWLKLIGKYAAGQLIALTSRLATDRERRELGVQPADLLGVATVTRKWPTGDTLAITRRALVKAAETTGQGFKPIEREPWEMAEKRARVRALRTAFRDVLQIAIPQLLDSDRGDAFEGEATLLADQPIEPAEIVADNEREAAATALKAFNATWREMGHTQASTHQALRLECRDRPHDVRQGYCTAAKERVQRMMQQSGVTEAEGWETLTLAIESVGPPGPAEPAPDPEPDPFEAPQQPGLPE